VGQMDSADGPGELSIRSGEEAPCGLGKRGAGPALECKFVAAAHPGSAGLREAIEQH